MGKQDIERRIAQKEEEFATTKKNFGKALEGIQVALADETKGKVEALRMKKKLDNDVIDLGVALEHANAANAEATDNLLAADRRCNSNQNALEEARTLLDQA